MAPVSAFQELEAAEGEEEMQRLAEPADSEGPSFAAFALGQFLPLLLRAWSLDFLYQ